MEADRRTFWQYLLLAVLLLIFVWNFYSSYKVANRLAQIGKALETKEAAAGLRTFSLARNETLAETIRNQWSEKWSPSCAEEKQFYEAQLKNRP